MSSSETDTSFSNKIYLILLELSLCLSAVLCWLYVTKPVIQVVSNVKSQTEKGSDNFLQGKHSGRRMSRKSSTQAGDQLVPADDALPGVKKSANGKSTKANRRSQPPVDPKKILATGAASGWEMTNLKMQHILRADLGGGELENIVLNVPVLYQTRTMRWTPSDVRKAHNVLRRLMVYEQNLSKLRQDGQVLLHEWNQLLEKSVPVSVLRADSPSLPENHTSQQGKGALSKHFQTIKVE